MFTQPCFIRNNTREIIEKLEELGYDYAENGAGAWFIPLCQLEYIGVNLYSKGYYMGINGVWSNDWYDCGTNEQLFLALAALRDDSDKDQIFVLDADMAGWNNPSVIQHKKSTFIKCIRDKWNIDDKYTELSSRNFPAHKATPQELIEHFKDK